MGGASVCCSICLLLLSPFVSSDSCGGSAPPSPAVRVACKSQSHEVPQCPRRAASAQHTRARLRTSPCLESSADPARQEVAAAQSYVHTQPISARLTRHFSRACEEAYSTRDGRQRRRHLLHMWRDCAQDIAPDCLQGLLCTWLLLGSMAHTRGPTGREGRVGRAMRLSRLEASCLAGSPHLRTGEHPAQPLLQRLLGRPPPPPASPSCTSPTRGSYAAAMAAARACLALPLVLPERATVSVAASNCVWLRLRSDLRRSLISMVAGLC
jgi:hypothetical protein